MMRDASDSKKISSAQVSPGECLPIDQEQEETALRAAKNTNTTKSVLSFYRILSVINIYFLRFICLVSVYKPIQAKHFTYGYNRLLILFSLQLLANQLTKGGKIIEVNVRH